jgi:aconitase A
VAIVVRSFARIHESNPKKPGLLPLTVARAADHDNARATDP